MELGNQVCSLELAKQLKALGVRQNGYFCHVQYGIVDDDNHEIIIGQLLEVVPADLHDDNASCILSSAFTVSELTEMLPNFIRCKSLTMFHCIRGGWWACYQNDKGEEEFAYWDHTLADVLAKMLICLIEKNEAVPFEYKDE